MSQSYENVTLRREQGWDDDEFEDDAEGIYDSTADEISGSATTIELTVSCRELHHGGIFAKNSPMVVMYKRGRRDWTECSRTEQIEKTSDPDFVEKLIIDYYFEEIQPLRFDVYTNTKRQDPLSENNLIGSVTCSLGEIIGSKSRYSSELRFLVEHVDQNNKKLYGLPFNKLLYSRKVIEHLRKIEGGRPTGKIIILPEQLAASRDTIYMEWYARKLDKKDIFGKSDPFMVFYKYNPDGSYSKCYESKHVKNTLDPNFETMKISLSTFCNGDYDRQIKVEIYDWNRGGKHSTIGMFSTTLRQLVLGPSSQNTYQCINPTRTKKKGYQNSGTVYLQSCHVETKASFIDFIRSGTELSFVVAVDFTSSNGDQRWAGSLHFDHPGQPSPYHQAIEAVGDVICHYDTDGMFPAYGFGAQLPPSGYVSDHFALNMDDEFPSCQGIDGIIIAYQQCVENVGLCEPTNFAPIIKHVSQKAALVRDSSNYFVLLIVTDGKITDLSQTKEAIFLAAKLPLSIIIVGVGDGNFKEMKELDGDTIPLTHRGAPVERDIVQFVAMNDFLEGGQTMISNQEKLAKEVLEEIPEQLVQYMTSRGFHP